LLITHNVRELHGIFYGKKAEEENMGDEEIQKYLDTLGDLNKLKTAPKGLWRITLLSTLIILKITPLTEAGESN